MSELRHDALTDRTVLVSRGRAARPHTSTGPAEPGPRAVPLACPFCPGHEAETPPEVARTGPGAADTPGWRVRVVPNLYPLVGAEGSAVGGAHEVIVLSPDHDRALESLDDAGAERVLIMARERIRHHADRAHVQLFVNQGRPAGASLAHPHAQLVAMDFVPPEVSAALDRWSRSAPPVDLVASDLDDARDRELEIHAHGRVHAWCPHASASPYEVRLAALGEGADLADASDDVLRELALTLRDVLAALALELDRPPYNVVLHAVRGTARFHWWVEVVPRVTVVAGFELGTGVLVNVVEPHDAAERLRAAIGRSPQHGH